MGLTPAPRRRQIRAEKPEEPRHVRKSLVCTGRRGYSAGVTAMDDSPAPPRPPLLAVRGRPVGPASLGVALVAVACALLVGVAEPGAPRAFTALAFWVAGLASVMATWGPIRPRLPRWSRATVIDVLALTALAASWRLVNVGHLPPNHLGDEAHQAIEALRFLRGDLHSPFAASLWYGVPRFYMWVGAIWMYVFGTSIEAWRALTATAGTLTVPLLYLSLRLLVPGRSGARLAALAGLALCFGHTHIYFSRLGSNQGFDGLFLVVLLCCIGLGRQAALAGSATRERWWMAAGLVAGLGFYFYFALRFVAAIGAVVLLVQTPKGYRKSALQWYAAAAILTVAPLLAGNWGTDHFMGRTSQVLLPLAAEPAAAGFDLAQRLWIGLTSIQGRGLRGWYESGAGLLVSRLELVGLVVGLAATVSLRRAYRVHGFLFVSTLAAVALLTENPVASQRSSSLAVSGAVLIAVGFDHLAGLVSRRRRESLAVALVALAAFANIVHLFLRYMPHRQLDPTALAMSEVARYLDTRPDVTGVTFCGAGQMYWGGNPIVEFRHPEVRGTNVEPDWPGPAEQRPGDITVVLPACRELGDRLRDLGLSGRSLVFRRNLGPMAAARMLRTTGGLGYLSWVDYPPDTQLGGDDEAVFSLFPGGVDLSAGAGEP